jgi:hypothetical protein
MLRHASIATLLSIAFTAACGGGANTTPSRSGLPEDEQVTSLSDADLETLCNWVADYEGGVGTTLACGETVDDPTTCMSAVRAATNCPLTVSQYETCAAALRANACTALGNPACGVVAQCGS